jgi:hypothetical protein
MTSAAELVGLILVILAFVVANVRRPTWRPGGRRATLRLIAGTAPAVRGPAGRPGRPSAASRPASSVEDGIPRPAALQLEEAVGLGDEQHAVPQARGILAARNR